MLSTNDITRSNKTAQKLSEQSRVAVDQAAVVIADASKVAAKQTVIAAKCAGTFAVAFVRGFFRK